MSCPQLNFKNNGQSLLFKTILLFLFFFLSFFATDGKDLSRLQLEKIKMDFSSFDAISTKKYQKTYYGSRFLKTFY